MTPSLCPLTRWRALGAAVLTAGLLALGSPAAFAAADPAQPGKGGRVQPPQEAGGRCDETNPPAPH